MSYETASQLLTDPDAPAEQLHEAAISLRGAFERAEHTIGLLPGGADDVMVRAYRAAADRGSVPAMLELGSLYASGAVAPWAPHPGKDVAQAIELFRRADAAGSREGALAWTRTAYFARDEEAEEQAVGRLTDLHDEDRQNADVLLLVGHFLSQGYGFEQNQAEALPFFEAAAAHGNADAAFELSIIHSNGLGVPADPTAGVEWTRRAADLGSARAQSNLGGMYAMGQGVDKDPAAAVEWYGRAGENGHARAAFIAGVMLLRGDDGLEADSAAAEEQFATAEEFGLDVDEALEGLGISR
ncbi:tetratricopeptide repeat protein [Microbacterium sp. NPDC057650]|uniref:tetratricopeptide repeat protein n=1 Tax=unclassified Microbacterium TaxID=2609290 RepID=UPI00366DE24C